MPSITVLEGRIYRLAPKSKPLPNDQKMVLNRIKSCE